MNYIILQHYLLLPQPLRCHALLVVSTVVMTPLFASFLLHFLHIYPQQLSSYLLINFSEVPLVQ